MERAEGPPACLGEAGGVSPTVRAAAERGAVPRVVLLSPGWPVPESARPVEAGRERTGFDCSLQLIVPAGDSHSRHPG